VTGDQASSHRVLVEGQEGQHSFAGRSERKRYVAAAGELELLEQS
jgi:hypothetical protein